MPMMADSASGVSKHRDSRRVSLNPSVTEHPPRRATSSPKPAPGHRWPSNRAGPVDRLHHREVGGGGHRRQQGGRSNICVMSRLPRQFGAQPFSLGRQFRRDVGVDGVEHLEHVGIRAPKMLSRNSVRNRAPWAPTRCSTRSVHTRRSAGRSGSARSGRGRPSGSSSASR